MASEEYGARDSHRRGGHALSLAQRSTSYNQRTESQDSWIEISSQPSSSSLSSNNDEIVTTGLRVHQDHHRRRRRMRQGAPSHLNITSRAPSAGTTSSQEEYEESESESDRIMTSSNEGLAVPMDRTRDVKSPGLQSTASDDEDEDEDDRTAINYPTNNHHAFTPQPNAFSHPSSQPTSYFPQTTDRPVRPSPRHSYPPRHSQHSPYNMVSPGYNAAADHDAALRASLSTLISFAGAARGLPNKQQAQSTPPRQTSNRVEATTLRMVPESAMSHEGQSPPVRNVDEPAFKPTIRRTSTSTNGSADTRPTSGLKAEGKRKAGTPSARSSSKDRRITKKRRASGTYGYADGSDMFITPTLLTWVVIAGVGVVISALSFSAGYSMGKEAGRLELGISDASELGGCASEASRTGLGLRKLKFGSVARSVGVGA